MGRTRLATPEPNPSHSLCPPVDADQSSVKTRPLLMAMRFQALIAVIARMRFASSSPSKYSAACSYTVSGRPVPAMLVMASVSASAARSRPLNSGLSCQAKSA